MVSSMSRVAPSALLLGRRLPNVWDIVAILCVVAALIGIAHVARFFPEIPI